MSNLEETGELKLADALFAYSRLHLKHLLEFVMMMLQLNLNYSGIIYWYGGTYYNHINLCANLPLSTCWREKGGRETN